ncbi:MAG: 5'-nucleotidase C-terminal domain-containing protein [Myxococcota bacterium]|nr:5'-nucleotidase C-terminal domain-containing protein [Myxococcota bacterium]
MNVTLALLALLTAPVELVYHADLEGQLAVPRCTGSFAQTDPDYAAQVAAIQSLRESATERGVPQPVVLLGGDQIAPDLFTRMMLEDYGDVGAQAIAAVLGRAPYDAITLGNHELSTTRARLERFVAAATASGMPVVLSNLKCDAKVQRFCTHVTREVIVVRGDQKIAILATLSPRVAATIGKSQLAGIELVEPAVAIAEGVVRLRRSGVNAVVLMMQINSGQAGLEEVLALQRALPADHAPDVIMSSSFSNVDGQRQTLLVRQDGSPSIVGSSSGARGVTLVTMTPQPSQTPPTLPHIDATAIRARTDQRDEMTAQILAPYHQKFCELFSIPIGKAGTKLPTTKPELVNYMLHVMQRATQSEIAIINTGTVYTRAFPLFGPWTRATIRRALPYPTQLGTLTVHGADLHALLEKGEASGKLTMLGAARPEPGKPFKINGRAIDKTRGYHMVTSSYVASGGDAGFANDELKGWRPTRINDVRELVESEMNRGATFDVPASERLLTSATGDLVADWANTSISNNDALGDAQLARAQQQSIKVEIVGLLQLDHPRHRWDSRLNGKYGYTRTRPAMMPAVGQETLDLVQLSSLYTYRGLTTRRAYVPSPYSRLAFETELSVPDTRTYRHAELTHTAGGLFTLHPKLRLRAGAGYRTELFAQGDSPDPVEAQIGGYRFIAEVGATLDPHPIKTVGHSAITVEANLEYFAISPFRRTEHQLRASSRLSLPLVPLLFLTAGLDVFVVDRETAGRGASIDTTIGLKLHLDASYQSL